jgi:TolB protein
MKKLILFTLTALLVTSCLPQDTQLPQSPLLPLLERKTGLIAYMGLDGNIYVSDQSGGKLKQLTDDASIPESQQDESFLYYQYPTWAKDGNQLAFVGAGVEGNTVETNLMVANLEEDSLNEVYTSQNEHPFYLYWSPDNAKVSFLSSSGAGQNSILQSVPAGEGGERTILDVGLPYYWSWAPNGQVMIIHAGSEEASVQEHLAFLRPDTEILEYGLDIQPASFQAPAWSPDGSRIALTRSSGSENQLIVTDSAGRNPKTVGTFTSKTAFAWSSDGTRLAYLDGTQALANGAVGALHVVDMQGSKEIIEDQEIAAFFWSPNGEKIAYFILLPITNSSTEDTANTDQQYAVQLNVLDVEKGESWELFTYRPTEQFLNILPIFDQYHQSATIWSPDNNNLVISFVDEDNNPGIVIAAASGQLEPRLLAEGYIAFWSWK